MKATLDKAPREVAAMFDGVARRYDLTNTVLSAGLDRHWRTRTRQVLELGRGDRVLDLAAGTGVSTAEMQRSGAQRGRLRLLPRHGPGRTGGARAPRGRRSSRATGCTCPSPTRAFDAASIAFGLRNIADPQQALRELARVVRPGRTAGGVRVQPARRSRRSGSCT